MATLKLKLFAPRSTGLSGFVHFRYGGSDKINGPLAFLGRYGTISAAAGSWVQPGSPMSDSARGCRIVEQRVLGR